MFSKMLLGGKSSAQRTAGHHSCGCLAVAHLFLLVEKKGRLSWKWGFTRSCFPSRNSMHDPFTSPTSNTTNRIAVMSAGGVTTDGAQRPPLRICTSQARCWGDAAPWGWEDLFFSALQFLRTGWSAILHDIWETKYLWHSYSPQERFDVTTLRFLANLKVKNETFFWVRWEGVELTIHQETAPQGLSAYTRKVLFQK